MRYILTFHMYLYLFLALNVESSYGLIKVRCNIGGFCECCAYGHLERDCMQDL